MYTAKDKRQFASKPMGEAWDKHIEGNPGAAMKGKEGEGEGGEDDAVMQEHGPAHTTHIKAEGQEGKGPFTVQSQHKDGHMHKSEGHADKKAAHDHSMKMMGGDEPAEKMEHEGPEDTSGDAGDGASGMS